MVKDKPRLLSVERLTLIVNLPGKEASLEN